MFRIYVAASFSFIVTLALSPSSHIQLRQKPWKEVTDRKKTPCPIAKIRCTTWFSHQGRTEGTRVMSWKCQMRVYEADSTIVFQRR